MTSWKPEQRRAALQSQQQMYATRLSPAPLTLRPLSSVHILRGFPLGRRRERRTVRPKVQGGLSTSQM